MFQMLLALKIKLAGYLVELNYIVLGCGVLLGGWFHQSLFRDRPHINHTSNKRCLLKGDLQWQLLMVKVYKGHKLIHCFANSGHVDLPRIVLNNQSLIPIVAND